MDETTPSHDIRILIERVVTERFAYYKGLEQESDRGAAILAASHFEKSLEDAIACKFVVLDSESRNALFGARGPLFPFAAKIDVACAMGICSKEVSKEWHEIRRIRNEFAHASTPINFDGETIRNRVKKLTGKNFVVEVSPREQYINYLKLMEETLA